MSRLVLQITGEAGAGKSETCAHLDNKFGFATVLVSDIIRDYAITKGITLKARGDYIKAHHDMKRDWGMDIVARTVLGNEGSLIVVDGIRVPNDVDRIRHAGSNVVSKVVSLDCPSEVRFVRARGRDSAIDPDSYRQFLNEDLEDAYSPDLEGPNTFQVMAEADYHIDASRPQPEVLQSIDELVVPLLAKL